MTNKGIRTPKNQVHVHDIGGRLPNTAIRLMNMTARIAVVAIAPSLRYVTSLTLDFYPPFLSSVERAYRSFCSYIR
jgi:hypothetical protein